VRCGIFALSWSLSIDPALTKLRQATAPFTLRFHAVHTRTIAAIPFTSRYAPLKRCEACGMAGTGKQMQRTRTATQGTKKVVCLCVCESAALEWAKGKSRSSHSRIVQLPAISRQLKPNQPSQVSASSPSWQVNRDRPRAGAMPKNSGEPRNSGRGQLGRVS
jgi:hypothetical protein